MEELSNLVQRETTFKLRAYNIETHNIRTYNMKAYDIVMPS